MRPSGSGVVVWTAVVGLPQPGGSWQQVIVEFANSTRFRQEGWGHLVPWNPSDVLGIQIQSQGSDIDEPFDFWIDDVYLFR